MKVNPLLAGGCAAVRHQTFRINRPCIAAPTSAPDFIMWITHLPVSEHRRCHLHYSKLCAALQPPRTIFQKEIFPSKKISSASAVSSPEQTATIYSPHSLHTTRQGCSFPSRKIHPSRSETSVSFQPASPSPVHLRKLSFPVQMRQNAAALTRSFSPAPSTKARSASEKRRRTPSRTGASPSMSHPTGSVPTASTALPPLCARQRVRRG